MRVSTVKLLMRKQAAIARASVGSSVVVRVLT
jgi:hypothetical protein